MGNTELMNQDGPSKFGVTQMNRSGGKGRNSCVDAEVCANLMISKEKNLKNS